LSNVLTLVMNGGGQDLGILDGLGTREDSMFLVNGKSHFLSKNYPHKLNGGD